MKARIAHALVRLYPRPWRARYEDEFLALVADRELTWRDVADIIGAVAGEWARAVFAPRTELAALHWMALERLLASVLGAVAIDWAGALVAATLHARGWQTPLAGSLMFAIQTGGILRYLVAQWSSRAGVSRLELSAWVLCLCAVAPLAHLDVYRYVPKVPAWSQRSLTLEPVVATLLFLSGSTRAALDGNRRAQELWRNRWRDAPPNPLGLR